jgi:hypothetical protein
MTDQPATPPEGREPGAAPAPSDPAPPQQPDAPAAVAPILADPPIDFTAAPPDPWAHRRGEPRTLAAMWLLFLFAATILSVGAVGLFGLVSTDVYRPAARVMLEIVTVGVVVLWPMVRLSQEAPRSPLRAMLGDCLVILGPTQAVIWPQALTWMAGWPTQVVGIAAGLVTGWGVLIAGLLALYFARTRSALSGAERSGQDARHGTGVPPHTAGTAVPPIPPWAMMALIVLLVTLGPLIAALRAGGGVDWLMSSPLTGIYEVTRDRLWTGQAAAIDERHRVAVWLCWLAGAAVWGFAWVASGRSPGVAPAGEAA